MGGRQKLFPCFEKYCNHTSPRVPKMLAASGENLTSSKKKKQGKKAMNMVPVVLKKTLMTHDHKVGQGSMLNVCDVLTSL